MSMPAPRFLADEGCDFAVVRALHEAGFDVVAVCEIITRSNDSDIIKLPHVENRVLLTEDKDFGWLVFVSHADSAGVVLIRFPAGARSALPALLSGWLDSTLPTCTTLLLQKVYSSRLHFRSKLPVIACAELALNCCFRMCPLRSMVLMATRKRNGSVPQPGASASAIFSCRFNRYALVCTRPEGLWASRSFRKAERYFE